MFDNIGGKLKILAWVVFICGAVCSIISGIVLLVNAITLSGFIFLIVGPLICWVVSFPLYGFGVLIENSEKQNSYLKIISEGLKGSNSKKTDISTIASQINNKTTAPTVKAQPKTTAPATKPQPKPIVPITDEQEKEETYLFALQMYQQRSYDIARNAFSRIRGYKDADTYLQKLM